MRTRSGNPFAVTFVAGLIVGPLLIVLYALSAGVHRAKVTTCPEGHIGTPHTVCFASRLCFTVESCSPEPSP